MKQFPLVFTAAILACGSSDLDQNGVEIVHSTIPHYTITAVDTIGVEFGDSNYVFGQTDAALFSLNGDILVLDGSKKQISLFDSGGEFQRTIGGPGSGPGEFLRPMTMALLGNGKLAVSDPSAGRISLFNQSYTYEDDITGFFPAPPHLITGADSEAIIGLMKQFNVPDEKIGYTLVRLNGTAEPVWIYAEEMMNFEPTMIGPGYTETTIAFTSDPAGNVFTSAMSTDSYLIEGFTPDGELFLSIERPDGYEPVEKTALEMEDEISDFNTFLLNREASGGGGRMQSMGIEIPVDGLVYEPDPYHYSISDLTVDSENRIWARRGSCGLPFFDVYDIEGKLLFTASVEEGHPDAGDWNMITGDGSLLAYSTDPENYPMVVILRLE